MNKSGTHVSLLATLATGLLLSTVPAVAPVEATSAIQRCQSPDGTLVYTDKACAVFGAKAVPMPDALMTRIVREESTEAETQADAIGAGTGYADAATPLDENDTRIVVSRRSPDSGCARTPTQLAMDLRGALALGDVNRVAESYDWAGMSNRQGQATLDRLQRLIGKPVLESRYFNAQITSSPFAGDADATATATATAAAFDTGPAGTGMLQLTLGSGAQASVIDFDVHRYAGCYFIRY